jgi:hypothetical protein
MVNMDKWIRENSGNFTKVKSRKIKRSYMINGVMITAKDINSAKCKAIAIAKVSE